MTLTSFLFLAGSALTNVGADDLRFPADQFETKSVTVKTSSGEKVVQYRYYAPTPYVAKPVDKEFQSLTVKVPISVDGKPVDASKSPILFNITVGGYLSASVNRQNGFAPPGGLAPGERPAGGPPAGMPPGGMPMGMGKPSKVSSRVDLALAAGYVVVTPGARGRDNKSADGTYYGKAPAAIVDLKAAVRYIRHNRGVLPGDSDHIVSVGVSAGGALSALLGASGDTKGYDSYLDALGAAKESDRIFASADFCPITDLEHADGAYEWMFGTQKYRGQAVDATVSSELKDQFVSYQDSLKLKGKGSFGVITAANYGEYMLSQYVFPSATEYLGGLSEADRSAYLEKNAWIRWDGKQASFTFADYVSHVGRSKGEPAFDDFELSRGEPILFGTSTTNARHFTDYSLRKTSGDAKATVAPDLKELVRLMNPMGYIRSGNKGMAGHWWIRHGSSDSDTSLAVILNLATSLENEGKDVNTRLYWDAGHGADEDPEAFIGWIGKVTGKPAVR